MLEFQSGHTGVCALTCALKNRAYGASVPAGGVCLQGQFDGIWFSYESFIQFITIRYCWFSSMLAGAGLLLWAPTCWFQYN